MSYVLLEETNYQTYTSVSLSVIDLTNNNNLTSIVLISPSNNYNFSNESVTQYNSSNLPSPIDLTDLDSLYDITILSIDDLDKFNLATSNSVLLALRVFITIDFASRTSFNSNEALDFDPPQYWIGA